MIAIFKVIWTVLESILLFNLIFPTLLFLLYLLLKGRKGKDLVRKAEADYGIIVTAYEQTDMLPTVVNSLLQLDYTNYLIYIVADKCDISNLRFHSDKVVLLRPEEVLSSNTRSHFYAINRFQRNHERLTIIDSDNLVDPQYLNELNKYFDKGYEAVQGVRKAKNLNTMVACLDAARDLYYHFYDGKLLYECGSSATLAGSGMAFTTALYKSCLEKLDIVGAGFDKVLQYQIVKTKKVIAFAEDAVVYDEKTSKHDQLVKQRSRWINTWFKYFSYGFSLAGKGILQFNRNQFLFGLVLLRPPLFIFLLLSLICAFVNIFISPIVSLLFIIGFLFFLSGFFVALNYAKADGRIYKSLKGIPMFMFYQVVSLLNARTANKRSVATTHYSGIEANTTNQMT